MAPGTECPSSGGLEPVGARSTAHSGGRFERERSDQTPPCASRLRGTTCGRDRAATEIRPVCGCHGDSTGMAQSGRMRRCVQGDPKLLLPSRPRYRSRARIWLGPTSPPTAARHRSTTNDSGSGCPSPRTPVGHDRRGRGRTARSFPCRKVLWPPAGILGTPRVWCGDESCDLTPGFSFDGRRRPT